MTVSELRVPSAEAEIERLFAGWREELATRRKFVPAARNYAAARLETDVGLRVNEIRMPPLVRGRPGQLGANQLLAKAEVYFPDGSASGFISTRNPAWVKLARARTRPWWCAGRAVE